MHYVIFALMYMAGIFYASAIPGRQVQRMLPLDVPDYVLHALTFAGLAAFWYLALIRFWKQSVRRSQWLALAIVVLYGLTDEYHQGFVPGRDPSTLDLTADAVGAGAALLILGWTARFGAGKPAQGA